MAHKIMVIDDDQGLRSFLQKALLDDGYQVETVDRGAVGLQKLLTEGDYSLVLIDINMPEISGPTVCQALRKHEKTRDLPVVMMTAMFHSPEQIAQAKIDYGANEFLLKPFAVEDLSSLVASLLPKTPVASKEPDSIPIEKHSIPLLLQQFYIDKASGLLQLQRGEAKKIIYLKDGYPVFARSNVLSECLGRMLVKEKAISQADCDASVERSKESGRLQGTVLIEMGLLTPQELQSALVRQVTEKLLSTFSWVDGISQFFPGRSFKQQVTGIQLSPANLILQGISRYWSIQQLDEFLNPYRNDYLKQEEDPLYRFQDIQLSKRGEAIFNQCRGVLTLEQLLERHPLARREVQQVLAALLISEMLIPRTSPEEVDATEFPELFDAQQPIDEKLRRKILEDYKRIMQADYFASLGLNRQCGSSEVRRAYYKLAKEYHPDRFLDSGLSAEMKHKINEIFQYISQAYSVLSDPNSCATYLDELVNGPKKAININQVIEAETAYQEGRTLLKMRRYASAVKPLKRSIELSPEEPEYLTNYAWALFKSAPEEKDKQNKALEVLLASRELNPSLDLFLHKDDE